MTSLSQDVGSACRQFLLLRDAGSAYHPLPTLLRHVEKHTEQSTLVQALVDLALAAISRHAALVPDERAALAPSIAKATHSALASNLPKLRNSATQSDWLRASTATASDLAVRIEQFVHILLTNEKQRCLRTRLGLR